MEYPPMSIMSRPPHIYLGLCLYVQIFKQGVIQWSSWKLCPSMNLSPVKASTILRNIIDQGTTCLLYASHIISAPDEIPTDVYNVSASPHLSRAVSCAQVDNFFNITMRYWKRAKKPPGARPHFTWYAQISRDSLPILSEPFAAYVQ
jgi:hypothetical protein